MWGNQFLIRAGTFYLFRFFCTRTHRAIRASERPSTTAEHSGTCIWPAAVPAPFPATGKPQRRAGDLPRALRAVGRGWPVVCWALRCCACRACRTAWRLQPMLVLRLRMHAVCCMQTSECASIQQCVASCTVECCCTPSSSVQQNPTVYSVQQ